MPSVLFWLGTAFAFANPAVDPKPLIDQLGAPEFAARHHAQVALARLGTQAEPALVAAQNDPRPDVRGGAEVLLDRLKLRAASAPYSSPGRVSFAANDQPLDEAVAALAIRTGLKLRLAETFPDPHRRVNVRLGPLTPWEAVESFRVMAGLSEEFQSVVPGPQTQMIAPINGFAPPVILPRVVGGQRAKPPTPTDWTAVTFGPNSQPSPPADRTGAVRVRALQPQNSAHTTDRGSGVVSLALDLAFPSSPGWGPDTRVVLHRAEDERGRPIPQAFPPAAPDPDFSEDRVFFNNRFNNLNRLVLKNGVMVAESGEAPTRPNPRIHSLALIADGARKLRSLDGVIVTSVLVPNQVVLRVADLAAVANKSLRTDDGLELQVVSHLARPTGDEVRIRWSGAMGLPMPNGLVRPADPLSQLRDGLRFRSVSGTLIGEPKYSNIEWGNFNGFSFNGMVALTFAPGTPPTSFELLGTRAVAVELPFRLKDIPLP